MLRFLIPALLISAPALAYPATTLSPVSYVCGNDVLRVVYVNGADGKNFAIMEQMGEMIPMVQVGSASGSVFRAMDRNYSYELFTKGGTAMLQASGRIILADCTE